jgi:Domain of unknown function (DUF4419)
MFNSESTCKNKPIEINRFVYQIGLKLMDDRKLAPQMPKNPLPMEAGSTSSGIVFEVADVSPAKEPLPELPYQMAIETLLGVGKRQETLDRLLHYREEAIASGWYKDDYEEEIKRLQEENKNQPKIEAWSQYQTRGQMLESVYFHPFVDAFQKAYDGHRSLCLSPDMIWLLIGQGLANHINANAEQLRSKFVEHQGKVVIGVERDDFIKGSPDNTWDEVFGEFSEAIRKHIGEKTHDLLVPKFSTTGRVERAAAEIVLLDAMQSYFEYGLSTACGIPQIRLEGTVADWQQLLKRTEEMAQFDLEWWVSSLIPILKQFISAAQGNPDKEFWQSAYKLNFPGSGDIYITGWITAFFPYLKGGRKNESSSLTTDKIPSGLAKAPFEWNYYGNIFKMEFLGGFVGIQQDSYDLFLRPEIGWAILET